VIYSVLFRAERDDYRYSGSENEEDEPAMAGEPSSIVQAPGDNTLRRNFQQIQVYTVKTSNPLITWWFVF
jgi:phage portal protein BeeE